MVFGKSMDSWLMFHVQIFKSKSFSGRTLSTQVLIIFNCQFEIISTKLHVQFVSSYDAEEARPTRL